MKILKITLASVFLMACMPIITEAQVTLEFENASTALELAKTYTAALQSGDMGKMDSLLHKDIMVRGLGGGLDSMTKAQHKEYFTNSTNQYKHTLSNELYLPVKVTNSMNEGERVLSWGLNTITNKSTGKEVRVPYHTVCVIVDGKITRMNYWYDLMNIAVWQGYTITPPKN
jgi:ketosteroid isomerase-like protein